MDSFTYNVCLKYFLRCDTLRDRGYASKKIINNFDIQPDNISSIRFMIIYNLIQPPPQSNKKNLNYTQHTELSSVNCG